ncbi:MAG: hypothetical protein A2018_00615 [Alphaproteobacteria bacterium GWF2_58_20]|nr:MAG: hypothetical protein A2018_00615 [Alphaproteobacteria bacterium GWF2_58_20]
MQGHNLFGSDDLHGLIADCLLKIQDHIPGLEGVFNRDDLHNRDDGWLVRAHELPAPMGVSGEWVCNLQLSRVDCTRMLLLPSRSDALSFVRTLVDSGVMKYRGRASVTGGTAYYGKESRRSALKVYAKGPEYEYHAGKSANCLVKPELLAYCDAAVRFEAVYRGMELKRLGKHHLLAWNLETVNQLLDIQMEKINLSENVRLSSVDEAKIPKWLRGTYRHWENGEDLMELMSRRTWYRHRKALFEFGVDIAATKPRERQSSDVMAVKRVLDGRWMDVPDWARGTPLYHEPKTA